MISLQAGGMKLLIVTALSLFEVGSNQGAQMIPITRSGSQPSSTGSAQYFTGSVRIDPLLQAKHPSRASGARVTFEPGARRAWHAHPLGQTRMVAAGSGWAQR